MGKVNYHGANKDLILDLRRRDGDESFICPYCEKPMENNWRAIEQKHPLSVSIDHIVPVVEGGKTKLDNLVLCCRSCNKKRSKMPESVKAAQIRRDAVVEL